MGRKPTKNLNLPKGMRARVKPSGRTFYYLDTGGKPRREIPLGSDYIEAVKQWAQLTANAAAPMITFKDVADRYTKEVIPLKAPRTQKDNIKELENLMQFFNNPPIELDSMEPQHVRQYLDWRGKTAKTRANREKALLSHIFNFAREKGITANPNPCRGVQGFEEPGRDVYVEDDVFSLVYQAANQSLKDALDLAYLTGQRPADVLNMSVTHIKDNKLSVSQGKTKTKLRFNLVDEEGQTNALGALINQIAERKREKKISDVALVCGQSGMRLTASGLDNAFDRARAKAIKLNPEKAAAIKAFQFRDMRAKAGTDKAETQGLMQAQRQLGHKSIKTTEIYVRLGNIVSPTK